MSDIAIRVNGLSKRYKLGRGMRHTDTLRDSLAAGLLAPLRRWRKDTAASGRNGRVAPGAAPEMLWALHDVSFEVKQGEIVGVIGRNGAGKSTLLKILSRITEPTAGSAEIHGRAGTLLEVGTGFHPELTGRENIYLSGAIMGMRKEAMSRRLDEIVAFAEMEKFIDTPVKYFSSGMYVRTAFAVAAHLEPDILMVDEVLAVGDAAFQKKCLGKIGDVAKSGRTVLFVSHNLGQIRRLCETGLWLHNGSAMQFGAAPDVIASYQAQVAGLVERDEQAGAHSRSAGFQGWQVAGAAPNREHVLDCDMPWAVEIALRLDRPVSNATHSLMLQTPDGQNIGGWRLKGLALGPGSYRLVHRFPALPVRPGIYFLHTTLWDGAIKVDVAHLTPELIIATEDHSGIGEDWAGVINLPCDITVEG